MDLIIDSNGAPSVLVVRQTLVSMHSGDANVQIMGLSLNPSDRELLRGIVQQLVRQSKAADDATQVPLKALELLAAGEIDTVNLDQLLSWLEEAQRKTEGTAELARLISVLYDAQWSHCGFLMVVTIKGSSDWGLFLSSAQLNHEGLVGTSEWIKGDHERWELHRLDHSPNTFAFKNIVTGSWLSADYHAGLVKLRPERASWESWQMFTRGNCGMGCIALRSHHGLFLCQERPRHPTWNPWEWSGGFHRMFTGQLNNVANRNDVCEWETFTLCDADGQPLNGARWKQLEITLSSV